MKIQPEVQPIVLPIHGSDFPEGSKIPKLIAKQMQEDLEKRYSEKLE